MAKINWGRDLTQLIPGCKRVKYYDVVHSEMALRYGLANIPDEDTWKRAEVFAREVVDPLLAMFPYLTISSWFRSRALCRALVSPEASEADKKKAELSNHTRGDTVDLDASSQLFPVFKYVYEHVPYRELIAENFPSGWVHVCSRPGGNKAVVKLKHVGDSVHVSSFEEVKKYYSGV